MTKRGKALAVVGVVIAAGVVAATAWFVHNRAPDIDVTKSPGAMKVVGTVATEEIPFYDGDIWFLQSLSRGRAFRLELVRKARAIAGTPPLVSPRAVTASVIDESQRAQSALTAFFVDESGGKGTGYDRLYADRNADGSFAPEESVGLLENPPPGGVVRLSSGMQSLVFEPFDLQVGKDKPPRHVVARLGVAADGSAEYLYVGDGLRSAKVTLGGVECRVFLYSWFPNDFDGTLARQVIEYGPARISDYWPRSLWSINDSIYRLSTAPTGETVTVEEYVADAGTIEVEREGAWKGVTVKQASVGGANPYLTAAGPLLEEKGEFRVPIGRYYPAEVSVTKGAASTGLRDSSYSGRAHERPVRVSRGGRARLDLAAKPEVTFAKPDNGAHIRADGYLQVEALMKCPEWELGVSGIGVRSDAADANAPWKRVEPQVVVKDSSGGVVAQGPMPFG
jgi:hypothetical protein